MAGGFRAWARAPFSAVGILLTALLLALTVAFLVIEASWGHDRETLKGQAAFVAGSIGTEFVPLAVLEVLPTIDPDGFPSTVVDPVTGVASGGWIERYGFLSRRGQAATIPPLEPELADLLAGDLVRKKLPVGFSLSHYRPSSPDPAPLRFVGLACAGCHSAQWPDPDSEGPIVYGAGNPALDLIGFFESFRSVLIRKQLKPGAPDSKRQPRSVTEDADVDPEDLEYVLTLASIDRARDQAGLPPIERFWERQMIRVWLAATRGLAESNLKKYDLPSTIAQLRMPEHNPIGPGRTQPFVTLVNAVLDLPAKHNFGYSKIPAVFREDLRSWAQFDGSVRDHNTRSGLAAMTAGGSVHNLGGLGSGDHVIEAAGYTRTALRGPRWIEVFGTPPGDPAPEGPSPDAEAAALDAAQRRGRDVYRRHCATCHGRPDPDAPDRWLVDHPDDRHVGMIVPSMNPFQIDGDPPKDWVAFPDEDSWRLQRTDPERVLFRDARRMPYVLFTYFDREHPRKVTGEYYPLEHPLAIDREGIRNSGGYVNAPLDSAFVRAPYLHNGSIPTLAQLIHLEPRPEVYLRGKNRYDPQGVGLSASAFDPAQETPAITEHVYWTFDTSQPGNRNQGHHYPWPPDHPDRDENALRDLLAYLKTL